MAPDKKDSGPTPEKNGCKSTSDKINSLINEAIRIYNVVRFKQADLQSLEEALHKYSCEIEKSMLMMKELGIPQYCAFCATKRPGGGCCGEEIATWYDPVLLSLNLFMGIPLRNKSYYKGCCPFLGKNGCTLKARYYFCVNYLCTHLRQSIEEAKIKLLESQYGKELHAGLQAEMRLLAILNKKSNEK